MKIVLDKNNNFNSTITDKYLSDYNEKRIQSNLQPINNVSLIPRHDPILIEIIKDNTDDLSIVDIDSDDYTIIVEDGSEIVISDPVNVVNQLCHVLHELYHHSSHNHDVIKENCGLVLKRIIAIINTYP